MAKKKAKKKPRMHREKSRDWSLDPLLFPKKKKFTDPVLIARKAVEAAIGELPSVPPKRTPRKKKTRKRAKP
jgi:hypothetical protein